MVCSLDCRYCAYGLIHVGIDLRKRNDLTGRAAIVTGGNGGIGLGMARGLVQAGAAVVIAGRDQAKNAKATAELRDAGARAIAWAKDNIQVNAVLPGFIDTDLTRSGRAATSGSHCARARLTGDICLRTQCLRLVIQ
jgi:NAD(P)-dependent dehydrogenase (short-subunit alcohol dehydrogenase family)